MGIFLWASSPVIGAGDSCGFMWVSVAVFIAPMLLLLVACLFVLSVVLGVLREGGTCSLLQVLSPSLLPFLVFEWVAVVLVTVVVGCYLGQHLSQSVWPLVDWHYLWCIWYH